MNYIQCNPTYDINNVTLIITFKVAWATTNAGTYLKHQHKIHNWEMGHGKHTLYNKDTNHGCDMCGIKVNYYYYHSFKAQVWLEHFKSRIFLQKLDEWKVWGCATLKIPI